MLRFLFIFTALTAYLPSFAGDEDAMEPFACEGRAWLVMNSNSYSTDPWLSFTLTSYFVSGDTIIGGTHCSKVMRQRLANGMPQATYYCSFSEDGGQVLQYMPSQESPNLRYDFSASVGDTVYLGNTSQPLHERAAWKVESCDTIQTTERLLRRLHVSSLPGGVADVWVEGCGSSVMHCFESSPMLVSCIRSGEETVCGDDFAGLAQPAEYLHMLAVGKVWNQSYTDKGRPYNDYTFSYEIPSDTLVAGVRCYHLYSRNADRNGTFKCLGLLFEGGCRVFSTFIPELPDLLYDFSIDEPGHPIHGNMSCLVENVGRCRAFGHDVLRYGIAYPQTAAEVGCWVEGVGSDGSFLHPCSWTPGGLVKLLSCTLGDDTFCREDFALTDPSAPDMPRAPYRQMLCEGKVWNYKYKWEDRENYEYHTEDRAYTLHGDTIIGGARCMKMYLTRDGVSEYHSAWREDGKRVYCTFPGEEEKQLYDFSLDSGCLTPFSYLYNQQRFLSRTEVINVNGNFFTRYVLVDENFYESGCWVEGVGGAKSLFEPEGSVPTNHVGLHLVSCVWLDGMVFSGLDFQSPAVDYSAIGEVVNDEAHSQTKPNATYDLQGRRVSGTPRPGIYIRNGRKVVVK